MAATWRQRPIRILARMTREPQHVAVLTLSMPLYGAEGGTRTHTGVAPQQFLSVWALVSSGVIQPLLAQFYVANGNFFAISYHPLQLIHVWLGGRMAAKRRRSYRRSRPPLLQI